MSSTFRALLVVLLLTVTNNLYGQSSAPVVFNNDTLFVIENSIGAFSAQQRADLVRSNIRQLSRLPPAEFDSLRVVTSATGEDILYRKKTIATVTKADAQTAETDIKLLAEGYRRTIYQALLADYNDTSIERLSIDFGLFLLALLGFLLIFWLVNTVFNYFRRNLKTLQRNVFFQNNRFIGFFQLITPEMERALLLFLLRMLRFTVLGVFLYFYLPFMFSQISYTRGFGERLMNYVLRPLDFLAESIIGFLPNFLFIFIIVVAVNYLIRGLGYFAQQLRTERIKIEGFFPDWAVPTLNLFRVLIIIFTLVIIFPYLPGAGSDAFQGISVFIGLLLSLGSAGIISNVISGVILIYMRPFQIGDRVKINELTGDVVNRNLLVTKVKTLKNEEITIPNGTLLSGGIVNYTALAEEHGLILHTTITIGYDVDWKKVHQLLEQAAAITELIEKTPAPYVVQKSLDDWYVAYELNAYTKESHKMTKIYSNLHANIQDIFNAAGVEIMSSHYMALRDGNTVAVPTDYVKGNYQTPSFRVQQTPNEAKQNE